MAMLDHYLEAVRRHLPWRRQDDIIAELRANLEAQLEDKEAELGRRMTDAEIEPWLQQMGSPLQVAARYQPQQYLIGPALCPLYWFVLRLALSWCAVIYAIAKTVEILGNGQGSGAFTDAALQLPWVLFITAAVVTLNFAIWERSGASWAKLARGAVMSNGWQQAAVLPFDVRHDGRKKLKTYVQAVIEVVAGWLGLVWLLLVPHYPFLLLGPGSAYVNAMPYRFAPVWWAFYWCIVVLATGDLLWRTIDLLQDRWQGPHRAQRLMKNILGLAPLLIVLAAPGHALVVLKNPADIAHAAALAQINLYIYRGFEVIAAIVFLQVAWTAGGMSLEAFRKRLAAQ